MCRLIGREPIAHPPGTETRARPERATSGPKTRLDARIVFTNSYGASGLTIFGVCSRTTSSSSSNCEPISTSSRSMVRMSRTRGMRRSVTGSSVSSAAASAGSAEFLEPLMAISPLRSVPPVITNLSMNAFPDRRGHVVAGFGEQFRRARVGNAGGLRDDAAGAVQQFRIFGLHVHHQISVDITHTD